jgi:hypothetical protein
MANIVLSNEWEEVILENMMNTMVDNGVIKIMQGAITTDFSDLTTANSRSGDVLLTLDPDQMVSTVGDRTAIISASHAAATASGTAAWFWWYHPLTTSATSSIVYQVAGTISTAAPADLVIGDTNIVAGENYRLTNLVIKLPNSFGE